MSSRVDAIKSRLPGRSRGASESAPVIDPALLARRDRLVERFTAHQLDLGGVLYEMAIRDHVVMPVLLERAAVLQGIEADLKQAQAQVDEAEARAAAASAPSARGGEAGDGPSGRQCGSCGAVAAADSAYCAKCGGRL